MKIIKNIGIVIGFWLLGMFVAMAIALALDLKSPLADSVIRDIAIGTFFSLTAFYYKKPYFYLLTAIMFYFAYSQISITSNEDKKEKVLETFQPKEIKEKHISENFIQIFLPKNVSIKLPKNWTIISKNNMVTLDSAIEASLDLSNNEQVKSTLAFASNYYENSKTMGMVNIRYYPEYKISQNDINNLSEQEIKELDEILKEEIIKSSEIFKFKILSWNGTKRQIVNGIYTLITEYHRSSAITKNTEFRVRLVKVLNKEKSFTLTTSYNTKRNIFLEPITDRIISSIKYFTEQEKHNNDISTIQNTLEKTAKALNKKTPIDIDSETRLDTAQAFTNNLTYFFTMKTLAKSEINSEYLNNTFVPNVKNRACTTPELDIFFKNKASISYVYNDKNGLRIIKIKVTPEDCKTILNKQK